MQSTWKFIEEGLAAGKRLVLLYVCESKGSSPGRTGFVMAVDEDGVFRGTIGGGIMEVKLIELAKHLLRQEDAPARIKRQHHDKQRAANQSGMICSGEQTVILMPLSGQDLETIRAVTGRNAAVVVRFSASGMMVEPGKRSPLLTIESETNFTCITSISAVPRVHIFGAGHVGVALSRQMSLLGFRVRLYDNRPGLATVQEDNRAEEVLTVEYEDLPAAMGFCEGDLGVIVSFSYRTDKILLRRLYNLAFSYLGMMGSGAKIKQLKTELEAEGLPSRDLAHIFTPIGLNIFSKTAAEIAVSIAAEIILHRNEHLPTGRVKTPDNFGQ